MPLHIVQLHRDGILGETFDEFTKTTAHAGVILKPRGADWSKEAEALAPEPPRVSKNDHCYVRLSACFDTWDASGSGLLEVEEVAGAMADFAMWPKLNAIIGSERLDKAELTTLFRQLWADDPIETRVAILDALETAVAAFAKQYPFKEQVAKLFALLDKDQSKEVEIAELKPLLTELGSDLVKVSQVLFEAIDIDASGLIGLVEFEQFIRQLFGGSVGDDVVKSLGVLIAKLLSQKNGGGSDVVQTKKDFAMIGEADLKLNALFGAFDKDKSGFVEEGELLVMFADIGADWDQAAGRFGLKGGSDQMSGEVFRAVMKWVWGDLKEGVAWAATQALEVLQARAENGIASDVANIKISDAIRPDELMTDLRELFRLWDADKSGFIDGAELRVILQDAAVGEEAGEMDTPEHLSEDAFVGFIKTLWAGKTEEFAGAAVHALRKRMLGDAGFAEMEKTGAKESSVAEALFGRSEAKQRVVSVYDRWVAVHASSDPSSASVEEKAADPAADAAAAEGEKNASSPSLTVASVRELFGSLRKLPGGGELWGAVSDKLKKEVFDETTTLSSEEFYLAVKAQIDLAEDDDACHSSLVLLENSVRSSEQEAASKTRAETAVLRELFLLFDKDDSGALSVTELSEAMNKAGIAGDAAWENAGNGSFDLFGEDEEAKEMTAEMFIEFLVQKWGNEALQKAEKLLAGAKQLELE